MTQPPFDPYGDSMRPVHYPQAGPQPPYPGQMRDVDQFTAAMVRPGVVVVAFVLWLLAALSWPVGTLVRTLAEDGAIAGFGSVMALFISTCLGVAGVCGAVLLLRGSYHARLGLTGGSMVVGVLALAAVIVAARDGEADAVAWVVIVLRLVLPAAAAVFSFLPGTRHYFSGNLG